MTWKGSKLKISENPGTSEALRIRMVLQQSWPDTRLRTGLEVKNKKDTGFVRNFCTCFLYFNDTEVLSHPGKPWLRM